MEKHRKHAKVHRFTRDDLVAFGTPGVWLGTAIVIGEKYPIACAACLIITMGAVLWMFILMLSKVD